EEYLSFWSARPEVNRIWVSLYTPQVGEDTPEMLLPQDRAFLARVLPPLRERYPKFLMSPGIAAAILNPPNNPQECLFAKMSTNYSADLSPPPCLYPENPTKGVCVWEVLMKNKEWVCQVLKLTGLPYYEEHRIFGDKSGAVIGIGDGYIVALGLGKVDGKNAAVKM